MGKVCPLWWLVHGTSPGTPQPFSRAGGPGCVSMGSAQCPGFLWGHCFHFSDPCSSLKRRSEALCALAASNVIMPNWARWRCDFRESNMDTIVPPMVEAGIPEPLPRWNQSPLGQLDFSYWQMGDIHHIHTDVSAWSLLDASGPWTHRPCWPGGIFL